MSELPNSLVDGLPRAAAGVRCVSAVRHQFGLKLGVVLRHLT
jgi:hypothetical protein